MGIKHLHVVVPADDVDPFARQLIDDVLDPVAAHADASPDAIHPLIRAAHGDLGAVAGFAGHGPDFDHAVGNLGNFLLEQPADQRRPRAAEDHLYAAAGLLDLEDGGPNPLIGVVRLAGDLLAARQDGFAVLQSDGRGAPFISLYDAGDELALFFFVFVEQRVAFGFAHLLNDHLLGRLGDDAAQRFAFVERRVIVGARDRAVVAIDADHDFLVFAVLLFRGGNQRSLDGLEHDFLFDVLIAMDRIDDSQQFARIHKTLPLCRPWRSQFELSGCSDAAGRPSRRQKEMALYAPVFAVFVVVAYFLTNEKR